MTWYSENLFQSLVVTAIIVIYNVNMAIIGWLSVNVEQYSWVNFAHLNCPLPYYIQSVWGLGKMVRAARLATYYNYLPNIKIKISIITYIGLCKLVQIWIVATITMEIYMVTIHMQIYFLMLLNLLIYTKR